MININLVKKLVVIVIVALLCFRFVVVTYVSADFPTLDYPDTSNYSNDIDGATAYFGDLLTSFNLNTANNMANLMVMPFTPAVEAVEDYFGVDIFPDTSDYYKYFSDYYLGNGSSSGGGHRRGSDTLNTDVQYDWGTPQPDNALYIDDGNGGFFTIIDNSHVELPWLEVVDYVVYHRGKILVQDKRTKNLSYNYAAIGKHPQKPDLYYGTYTVPDSSNACFWITYKFSCETFYQTPSLEKEVLSGATSIPIFSRNVSKDSHGQLTYDDRYSTNSVSRRYYTIKSYDRPDITYNNTTLYAYDPTTNNFTNNYYYGADDSGRPVLYDINNNNQTYNINSNGKVDSGSKELYLFPDMSTLNDLDFNYFKNVTQNYYNLMFINLINKKGDGNNSDLYGLISSCLSQLNFISQNEALQTLYLRYINENIIKLFDNMGNSAENGDLLVLLNMLKQGILGENLDNDNIIDLLKKIEENTRPVEFDFDSDDINFKIETLSDVLYKKINFSSYFKQLDNLLFILIGSDYSNDIDYDKYFDISSYLSEDSLTLSMSTLDAPEVYGEELAQSDIDVNSSFYLTQCAVVRSDSRSLSGLKVSPSLVFNFMGVELDLFAWIDDNFYTYVYTIKQIIALVLNISWLFWFIKNIPTLFSDMGLVSNSDFSYLHFNKW